ncbi:hypothetical protein BKA56DRAFT_545033 [Ilyonectria sp. MPI-CAGE-AT-0026]|nr:hypothetical protein BKA56DRAFT_545033 [Ilyonectria sp. MPI-CAGE-AT-0026]
MDQQRDDGLPQPLPQTQLNKENQLNQLNQHHEIAQRVAIIGTGLAGLSTAYLLHNDGHKRYAVTLFEQVRALSHPSQNTSAASLSFDSASVAVRNTKAGITERVDLPMRAAAGGYYENLLRLYRHLRIPLHPIRFLFVFARATADGPTKLAKRANETDAEHAAAAPGAYFVHASNLHQMPPPWPGTRGVVPHLVEILYLIVCHFWFSVACFAIQPLAATASCDGGESFADYLHRIWLPRRYVSHYLVPLISSVSTCSHAELLAFPASDVVNYKKMSHGHQHYTVCGGVSQVQSRLAEGLHDIRLSTRVVEVVPGANRGVTVRWQATDGSSQITEQTFDRVVLAVSPDVAGSIFKPLRSILNKIPTLRVESSVLRPERESANFKVDDSAGHEPMTCAHHLGDTSPSQVITLRTRFSETNGSQTEALHIMPSGVVVSTCPLDGTADMKQSLKTARFTRTLRSTESRAAVEKIMGRSKRTVKKVDGDATAWVNGEDNVWLTGAWCWDGMGQDFAVGFVAGIAFILALAAIASVTVLQMTDRYGLGHWKLNIDTPLKSMWMNVGYWKNSQGQPVQNFEEACLGLLKEVVKASGILDRETAKETPRGSLAILDLGFGCGDQTWELARLAQQGGWLEFQYVGLTLNEAQVQASQRKIYREVAAADGCDFKTDSFKLFRANAAKPETWSPHVTEAVESLADEKFTETWLLALDCLYHFSPSRKPIFKYAANNIDAQVMVFDLLLNEKASVRDTLIVRAIGIMMGCPVRTFLTENEYKDQLVDCGYELRSIKIREVTEDVFSGLVKYLDRQDRALGEYGISLGGFKLAQRLFDWFARSHVVKAVIVVAHTKGKSS